MKRFSEIRPILVAAILLIWVTAIIALYYLVHKPFIEGQPIIFFTISLDIMIALAIIGLSGGLGLYITKRTILLSPLEELAVSTALGLGILSLVMLIVGILGLLYSWLAWIILLLGIFFFRNDIRKWFRLFGELKHDSLPLSRLELVCACFLFLIILLNLFRSLAPPVKWDSLSYHLEIPRQYIAAGGIIFLPENFYAGFPQLVELLFTWVMILGSPSAAAALGCFVGVVTLVGVEGFARRFTSLNQRFLAPAVLLSGFSISQSLSSAYVDIWIMLFGLGFFILIEQYRITTHRQYIILAGVMSGLAISTKYTSGILLVIGLVSLFMIDFRSKNLLCLRNAIWLSLISLLVVSPWLVKNWLLAGNPAYPFVPTSTTIDPWQQYFRSDYFPTRKIYEDFLLPIDVSLFSVESGIIVGKPEYSASIGALMLALIPGLLAGWGSFDEKQKNGLKVFLLAALTTWFLWVFASHIAGDLIWSRHYYCIFPVLSILAAAGFQAVSELEIPRIRMRRVLSVLVSLALIFAGIAEINSFLTSNPLLYLIGKQSQMHYIHQELGTYGEAMEEIDRLPNNSTVLFLWEPRTFYCQANCIMDGKLNNWWALMQSSKNSDSVATLLKQRNIDYVLINDRGLSFIASQGSLKADDAQILDNFRRDWLDPIIIIGEDYSLYRLRLEPRKP